MEICEIFRGSPFMVNVEKIEATHECVNYNKNIWTSSKDLSSTGNNYINL